MSRVYENCREIMEAIIKSDFRISISLRELEKVIRLKRGGDPRTIRNWIRNLTALGFLKRTNRSVFSVNYEAHPEMITLGVKVGQSKLA